jgi:hypothetical protein
MNDKLPSFVDVHAGGATMPTSPGARFIGTFVFTLAAVLSLDACGDTEEPVNKCRQLLDHVVELRTGSVPEADRAQHAKALRDAVGDQLLGECQRLTPKQVDCVLAAGETARISECAE